MRQEILLTTLVIFVRSYFSDGPAGNKKVHRCSTYVKILEFRGPGAPLNYLLVMSRQLCLVHGFLCVSYVLGHAYIGELTWLLAISMLNAAVKLWSFPSCPLWPSQLFHFDGSVTSTSRNSLIS